MTAILQPTAKVYFATSAGLPAAGWKLETFLAGTNTHATTWVDANQVAANTNPIILDARGEASVFWKGSYKVVLKDNLDNIIWTQDNITAVDFAGFVASLASTGGAAMVGKNGGGTVQDFISAARTKLIAARTYYVRTDGSDAGTGLVDASSSSAPNCAFATWQRAVTAALALDNSGFDVTIVAGSESGTKTWNFTAINVLGPTVGDGRIILDGNGANTVLNGSGNCIFGAGPIQFYVGNLTLTSAGNYGSVVANNGAFIGLGNPATGGAGPIFGVTTGSHMLVHDSQSYIAILNTSYTITGSCGVAHFWTAGNGTAAHEGTSVTITGNPTIPVFAQSTTGGYMQFASTSTFTGTCVGKKFSCQSGGMISTANVGINFLPGSIAGEVLSGGGYLDTGFAFNFLGILATLSLGANKQQIFDSAANYISIGFANAGTVSGFGGLLYDTVSGTACLDGPGPGNAGLSSGGNPMLVANYNKIGAKGLGLTSRQGAASTSYANDAAAAAGGVEVGGIYRNGSALQVRVI